eukprot:CAMPEP_0115696754 /NCGR_PEP_ID=MMETSP0272-20121206/65439_1 /TAXON_ID=71861 /ORGANISM="Scrippsiella trochoidea, Strain CCMP3099" /LENGTH=96 /DNA_ID=CAMNT_0003136983 /DNA_START=175 /DNA_END=462 /DNA_ORIENTATION=-
MILSFWHPPSIPNHRQRLLRLNALAIDGDDGWFRGASEPATPLLVTRKMLALRPCTSAKVILSGFRAVKRANRFLCHFSLNATAWASDAKLMNAKL